MKNLTKVKVTERVRTIEYAIRDVIVHAKQLARTGKKDFLLKHRRPPLRLTLTRHNMLSKL